MIFRTFPIQIRDTSSLSAITCIASNPLSAWNGSLKPIYDRTRKSFLGRYLVLLGWIYIVFKELHVLNVNTSHMLRIYLWDPLFKFINILNLMLNIGSLEPLVLIVNTSHMLRIYLWASSLKFMNISNLMFE